MRIAPARPAGGTRRLLATALLVALPLAGTAACAEDEPVDEGVGVEEGVGEDDD
jgi:hypothetical protein